MTIGGQETDSMGVATSMGKCPRSPMPVLEDGDQLPMTDQRLHKQARMTEVRWPSISISRQDNGCTSMAIGGQETGGTGMVMSMGKCPHSPMPELEDGNQLPTTDQRLHKQARATEARWPLVRRECHVPQQTASALNFCN
jgi:hypothetical protein